MARARGGRGRPGVASSESTGPSLSLKDELRVGPGRHGPAMTAAARRSAITVRRGHWQAPARAPGRRRSGCGPLVPGRRRSPGPGEGAARLGIPQEGSSDRAGGGTAELGFRVVQHQQAGNYKLLRTT